MLARLLAPCLAAASLGAFAAGCGGQTTEGAGAEATLRDARAASGGDGRRAGGDRLRDDAQRASAAQAAGGSEVGDRPATSDRRAREGTQKAPERPGTRSPGERDGRPKTPRRATPLGERRPERRARGSERDRGPQNRSSAEPLSSDARLTEAEAQREAESARAAVSEMIEGLAGGDEGVCTRLMTLRYVEWVTGLRGDVALRKCEHDVSHEQVDAAVEDFGASEVTERECVVRARVRIGDERFKHKYVLVKGDDRSWRVDRRVG